MVEKQRLHVKWGANKHAIYKSRRYDVAAFLKQSGNCMSNNNNSSILCNDFL